VGLSDLFIFGHICAASIVGFHLFCSIQSGCNFFALNSEVHLAVSLEEQQVQDLLFNVIEVVPMDFFFLLLLIMWAQK